MAASNRFWAASTAAMALRSSSEAFCSRYSRTRTKLPKGYALVAITLRVLEGSNPPAYQVGKG